MKPAILLIDLQRDFLAAPPLEPAADLIVAGAARLLVQARKRLLPVIHVWTTVDPVRDQSMPHWKRDGRRACVLGTEGHASSRAVAALEGETIIHKTFFSAFSTGELDRVLKSLGADMLILAGVHVHGCIRETVLDAYQRGLEVWVADDAIGSDDPLHAAITRRYLTARAARFAPVESCLAAATGSNGHGHGSDETAAHRLPAAIIDAENIPGDEPGSLVHKPPWPGAGNPWSVPICGTDRVSLAVQSARRAWLEWRSTSIGVRCEALRRLSKLIDAEGRGLADQMAGEIGKPVAFARAEIARSIALLNAAIVHAAAPLEVPCTADSARRSRPLGVIAVITPWNNPVAIPLGKIAPALVYGNAVVWKPSPEGSSIAVKLMECLEKAGVPSGLLNLVCGDRSTALALMGDAGVDAVTITGSVAAGYSAQDICGRRHVPLQAELGGNNAAIVWSDADELRTSAEVADAAFAFAGQRCTANRRVIIDGRVYDAFMDSLQSAVGRLVCGDPLDPETRVGPLISANKQREVAALVERARSSGADIIMPPGNPASGAFFPPTLVCCDDPRFEIVQEETFGPVLVVQKADDWAHAMELCNGVRQGLVASLFSKSPALQDRFLTEAKAGILKINMATADANVEAPFGGWKASGIGPPEHGIANREFYTRTQAVYRGRV